MVAIVSGNSLGLNLTSLGMLGQQGLLGSAAEGRSGQQAYVNVANGNLVLQHQDDFLAGLGPDAVALRTYNSRGALNDDNADNWGSGFYLQPLVLSGTLNTAGSTIRRTDRDGSVATYSYDTERGLYLTTEGGGAHDTISYIAAAGQFEWRDGSTGLTQRYEGSGPYRLLTSQDANGNSLSFAYNSAGRIASVTTSNGEVTYYDYSGNNLTQIRTVNSDGATQTRVRYGYDTSNRLASVTVDLSPGDNSITDGKTYTTTYTYDGTSTRIASVTQTDGSSLTFTYVQVGAGYLVASVKDALNQTTSFSYNFPTPGAGGTTTVSDPLGLVTNYDVDAAGQLTKITAPAVAGLSATKQFTYNASGDVLTVTDGEGRVITYEYDANGNQVLQRDHAGNTVTRAFDTRNQLLTETAYLVPDPDGAGAGQPGTPLTERYVYDAAGRNQLRFVISAEGQVTEHRYDGFGQRVASVTFGAAYPISGLASTAAPTEAQMTTWAGSQTLTSTRRTDFAYDARGQLQSRTTFVSVGSTGAGVVDGSESVARYVYDQGGSLLQEISPAGGATSYTYDGLGRVLSRTDAFGKVTLTQFNDASNKTLVTLANGLVNTSTYDKAGRLVSVLDTNAAAANLGETKYFYDAGGRLRMTQDPTGMRHWMLYDEAGRKVADIDPNGTLTEYGYDKNGQLTWHARYATAISTTGLIDAAGAPVLSVTPASIRPATSAADQRKWYSYDAANRLLRVAEAIGTTSTAAVTEHRYDGASRLVEVLRYANTHVASDTTLVRAGFVAAPAASASDRSSRNFYDSEGRLIGTLDAEGYLARVIYEPSGRLVERIAYATATNSTLRASGTLAQLVPAASANDIRSRTLHDAKGQVIAEIDGENYLTEKFYDANGNVTLAVRYANKVTAAVTATSTRASIRPASSSADRSTLYEYEGINRLFRETNPEGVITQYTYDSVGNVTSTVRAVGTTEVRTVVAKYDLQGRLTGELSAEGAALLNGSQTQAEIDAIWAQHGTSHTYDAAGRRTSTTDANGNRTLFYYNADNQLRHTINALGEVQERRYDNLGRVVLTVAYTRRMNTAGFSGGIVTQALVDAVAAIADSTTDTRTTITYTRNDKVASTTDAQGFTTNYTYNAFGDEIGSTQALGSGLSLTQTHSVDRRGLRTSTTRDASALNVVTSAVYDAFGRVTRSVDGNGRVRTQSYDRLGQVVTTVDPLNATRSTTYNAFGQVLTQTDALGNTTSYAYDKTTRAMTVTTPEGIVTKTAYTRHGQVASLTDGRGLVTTYTYNRNGELVQTKTAANTTTSTTYDAAGRVMETTDGRGKKVAYTYDAANRVLTRRVDPTGLNLTTTYAYDGKGLRVSVTDPAGVVTQFTYDRKGQVLTQAVDPAGLNLRTTYTYDGRGNTLTVTSPGGTVTQYVYDVLGRRTQERVDPAGLNLQRTWTYDKNGNAVYSTDRGGNATRYVYDGNNRLIFTVDAAGSVHQAAYDAESRVVKTVRYATPISASALPVAATAEGVQALITGLPTRDLVAHSVYDKDGRVAASVDGAGGVVRYTYGSAGYISSRTVYANKVDLATWTPGTLPAPVANSTRDERTTYVYDSLNRLYYTMDGMGGVVKLTYDANDNVLSRTAYAGTISTSTPANYTDITNALAAIANPARDSSVRYGYDAANRLTVSFDGTGAATAYSYDKNGNLIRRRAYATAVPVGSSTLPAATNEDRVDSMAYDAANRLVFEVDSFNTATESVYDADGNVVRRTSYAKRIVTMPALGTLATATNIRAAITVTPTADRSTLFGYDAAGRHKLTIDPEGAVTEKWLAGADLVVSETAYANKVNTSGLAAAPTLGTLKALVTANAADRNTRMAYDGAGQLLFTVDPESAVTRDFYDGTGVVTKTTRYAKLLPAGTANTVSAIAAAMTADPPDPADREEFFSYNAAGQLVSQKDALGATESYTYDGIGRKVTFVNRRGSTWTYAYNAAGRLITETSPVVAVSATSVDANGNVAAGTTVNVAVVTSMAYDALGNLTQRTEAVGRPEERTTRYEYDAAGRQIRVIYPAVGVYNAAGDALTTNGVTSVASRVENVVALETRTFYDALGNAVANIDVGGALSQKAYDRMGRLAYEVDALGYVTGYTRNTFGEVASLVRYGSGTTLANATVTQASEAATKAQIDAVVTAAGFNHADDRTIATSYDRAGRVFEVTEPIAFAYDSSVQQRDTVAKKTQNVYNAFGELVQVKTQRNASAWISTFHYYDKAGRSTATIDALGYLTQRTYDAVGNLTEVTEHANAMAAGGWNASSYAGLPAASADNRTVRYAYDRANRKTSETRLSVEHSTASTGTSTTGSVTTSYVYDAVGNLTRVTDALGKYTYTFYDALGRIRGVSTPGHASTATGATVTPLTLFYRDAHGAAVMTIEYANGSTGTGSSTPSAPDAALDRRSLAYFDKLGRNTHSADATGANQYASFDAYGNLAKKWQGVTGNDGITRTLFEVNVYDKLGRLVQTRTPASTEVLQNGLTAAYSPRITGVWGSITAPHKIDLGWSAMVDPSASTVRVQLNFSAAASIVRDYTPAQAAGGVDFTWTEDTGSPTLVTLMQLVSGQWVTKWQGTLAMATGSAMTNQSQAAAGLNTTAMEYNAFGEMTRKGVNGGRQEYFDYDTAGRLWRTNSGDGVDRIQLYDLLGNMTSEIRSGGSGRDNLDIKTFANAQAADASPTTRRIDIKYDALGRVTEKVEAARLELQGGVSVQRAYTTATVTQRPTWEPPYDEFSSYRWVGQNAVSLSWNNLATLGSGDIKVYLEYRTPVYVSGGGKDLFGRDIPYTTTGGTLRSYSSGMFNGDQAAAGMSLSWSESSATSDGGIGSITRVVVYKKDVLGNWVVALDQQPGYGANFVDVAAPANANTAVTVELRVAGTAGDTGWWTAGLIDFGNGYRVNTNGLALGSYEYRVKVKPLGEDVRTIGTGTISLTKPPLNSISTAISYGQAGTGVLAWAPPAGKDQVFRYRVKGSTGAWSTLAVLPRINNLHGVDTTGLAAATYQFELLWSPTGSNAPSDHATGEFTITAAQPAYWVPPVNLPPITGVTVSTQVLVGYDESGPIYSTTPHLVWNAANATQARYRASGGAWISLSINNAGQTVDESGVPSGVQAASLAGIAAGTYEFQIFVGSPPTQQATGSLTVYAGHYENRTGTRTASRQVWVDPAPYITGYDENGQPIYYDPPGYWQTEYYQETYTYQVWVVPQPTITVTTPPYTPGYWVAEVPRQYSVNVTTAPGSQAISGNDGTAIGQSAGVNGGDRWLRPTVVQKTDRWGNVIEITDPRSGYWKTTYKYNASNQLVQVTKPDTAGNISASSPITKLYYDKMGRQVAIRDANNNVIGTVYDAAGNLIEEHNADGLAYDLAGNLVQTDGGVITHRYNAFGERIKSTDAEGNVTTWTYDKLGRMLAMTQAPVTVYQVDASTYRMGASQWRSIVETWTYDQAGRKLTHTNGNGETLRYRYDLAGNVVETKQPLGQVLRAKFDAQGRKIAEVDANGYSATWTYDYFGRLTAHSDLGGARFTYTYDNARQLVTQTSTRGQNLRYGYDAAGQVTSITDSALGKVVTYMYDLSGRRIRERTVQGGVTYQDNHLAYDAQGNLRDVADARAHLVLDYDKVGNRTHIYTHVNYLGVSGEVDSASHRYFKYDAMNRQIAVDAADAAGTLTSTQGHRITYDKNGNRTSDTSWGNKVVTVEGVKLITGYNDATGEAIYYTGAVTYQRTTGWATEQYRYDGMNRLQSVERDGLQIDLRLYDGASRVVQSGPNFNLPQGYADALNKDVPVEEQNGNEIRVNRYDANGRMLHQRIYKTDGALKTDMSWDVNEADGVYRADGYDAAGNVLGYWAHYHGAYLNEYTNKLKRFDGYREGTINGVSSKLSPGTTTQTYDANGLLVAINDSTQSNNNRTFVNDAEGKALYVNQAGRMLRQLIVGGEVLGLYGAGVDPLKPSSGNNNNPNFANLVDFDFGYSRISANYPNASPGAYQVRTGDTLQSIAQSAYGDSGLWYRIAEANGLSSNNDLKVGQTLNIPNRVGTISNNATTFKPYDPSNITGSTQPSLAMPKKKASFLKKLIIVIIAIVVTVLSYGALKEVMAAWAASALAAAAGSVASQTAAIGMGVQDKFDWRGVALSAVGGALSAGLPASIGSGMSPAAGAALRAAIGNVATQGIAVAVGIQEKFDWRGVAASAVGAGVGQVVGEAFGLTPQGIKGMSPGELFGKRLATGLIAGTATAVARGGKVAIQQVAVDAFGNALGQSLAEVATPQTQGVGPWSDKDYVNGMDLQSDAATLRRQTQPELDAVLGAFNSPTAPGPAETDLIAAAGDYNLGRTRRNGASAMGAAPVHDEPGGGFTGTGLTVDPAKLPSFWTSSTFKSRYAPSLGWKELGEYLNPLTRLEGFAEGFSFSGMVDGAVKLFTDPEGAARGMQERTRSYFEAGRRGDWDAAARFEGQLAGEQTAGLVLGYGVSRGLGLGARGFNAVGGVASDLVSSALSPYSSGLRLGSNGLGLGEAAAARQAFLAERYGSPAQRDVLLNQIGEASTLSEAKGVVYAFREMKRLGFQLEDISLKYRGNQGLDLTFSKGSQYAIVEAKHGKYLSSLDTYAGGLRQGSVDYNISRLERYLQYGDGKNAAFANRLLTDAYSGKLDSFATFYRGRSIYELPLGWPKVPGLKR